MKNTIFLLIAALLTGCMSVKEVGKVNMISNRNVSMKENYVLVRSYAGSGKRDLKRNKSKTIDGAVENLVRSVPGGEFVMNAKILLLDAKYYAVDGDVYGLNQERNFKGFKVGDRVEWKDLLVRYTGVIVDLKNDREASVKDEANGKIRSVRYDEMSKTD
jgi:hypothetical protein